MSLPILEDEEPVDELLAERIRVFYKRMSEELRALEAYKLKRGYCIAGISCMRKALEGALGGRRACAHHTAAKKSGLRFRLIEGYISEYGKLQKKKREEEKTEPEAERAKSKPKAKPKWRSAKSAA